MISRKNLILGVLLFAAFGCGPRSKECPDCAGGGKVGGEKCDFCQGKGTVPPCSKCNGTGFFDAQNEKCNYCSGTGISPEYKKAYDDRKLKEVKEQAVKGAKELLDSAKKLFR
jgi:DnaJ-class molecular chaperone